MAPKRPVQVRAIARPLLPGQHMPGPVPTHQAAQDGFEDYGMYGAEEGGPPMKAARMEDPSGGIGMEEDVQQAGLSGQHAGLAEPEADAPEDPRSLFVGSVGFEPQDMTLNVIPTHGGHILMALSDGGLQYLVAAARASAGIKSGRYFYEVRIMEVLNPAEAGRRPQPPMPKQSVRLGFSAPGSSLFLGDSEDGVCFDSEGFFMTEKKRSAAAQKFARNQVVGVLLNLDPQSPAANTVSLFCEGQRVSDPQPLPEACRGKPLHPHVAFRNVSLHMHFGPEPMVPLPFKCRMPRGAAKADLEVVKPVPTKDGKYEVLFPMAVPDEGTFDWLDSFMAKNPHFVELSDRKLIEWALKSGLAKPKANQYKHSNDKPELTFGVATLDELAMRRVISAVAPLIPRHYVVMEVRANLIQAERAEILKRFNMGHYRKVAQVVIGEPPEEYKQRVQSERLREKQEKLDADYKARQLDRERKRQIALRQREMLEKRKAIQAQIALRKAEEERLAATRAGSDAGEGGMRTGEELGEGHDGAGEYMKGEQSADGMKVDSRMEGMEGDFKQDEKKEEDGKQEGQDEKKEDGNDEDGEEEEEPPVAELTPEEKALCFKPQAVTDLSSAAMSASFDQFTLPGPDEGFHEARYEWQSEATAKEYLRSWVLQKKMTTRVEDIQPSEWFFGRLAEWQKMLQEWQLKQKEFKQDPARREAFKAKHKEQRGEEQHREFGEGEELGMEGEEVHEGEERTKEGQDPMDAQDEAKGDDQEEKTNGGAAKVDIFSIEDVCDVADGEPLFANFMFEDWTLMSLRFEMHLLVNSFKRDVGDPDRPGMHEDHLSFYYQKYFRKQLNVKFFGKESTAELVILINDTVGFNESLVLVSKLKEDEDEPPHSIFVKLTEESRRARQRRIDAGDETAKLRFSVLATATEAPKQQAVPMLQPRVVPGSRPVGTSPYSNTGSWASQGPPRGWQQRPSFGTSGGYRAPMSTSRWGQGYAPKQGGWRASLG